MLDRGILYTLTIVFQRVVPASLFRWGRFYVYRVTLAEEREADDQSFDRSVSILRLATTDGDIQEQDEQVQLLQKVTYADIAQQSGVTGYAMMHPEAGCIGGGWMTDGKFRETELGIEIHLPAETSLLFSTRIETEFRGQGFYRILMKRVATDASILLVAIDPSNRRSLRAHRRFMNENAVVAKVLVVSMYGRYKAWTWGGSGKNRIEKQNNITESPGKETGADSNVDPRNRTLPLRLSLLD